MKDVALYSSQKQLERVARILTNYARLPFVRGTIPGSVMEEALAVVRDGRVLHTYDFVDVVRSEDRVGWQVKSTKSSTPVTWKRAKIPNSGELIRASVESEEARQHLGDEILTFCNEHAAESLDKYEVDAIGYARLIVHPGRRITYFERPLLTREDPRVFPPEKFDWRWSEGKRTSAKEQLTALHGYHRSTSTKWFAWHGRGENQLHFSGEDAWWPEEEHEHLVRFRLPPKEEKLSVEELVELLAPDI